MSIKRTYTNPVHASYFADPYVWEHQGIYYAIGTGMREAKGEADNQCVIPLLRSEDFVTWRAAGKVLNPPDPALGHAFWAPETAYHEGRFFLYYSVGHKAAHQLRVAAADRPEGPYTDVAGPLLDPQKCSFAIDAHAFKDDDGQWYLFYARNFRDTEGGRIGTAVVVDRLIDMTRLAGEERIVLRAKFDWQLFNRKQGPNGQIIEWHTIEGACARKHGGRYYCFYSGGCWKNESYGVDYAVADQVMGPYSGQGAEQGPRVLRSVAGRVPGPGHNSIIRGPDGKTDYMFYHAWNINQTARRMCLDKLIWTSNGPRCNGPTDTAQIVDL